MDRKSKSDNKKILKNLKNGKEAKITNILIGTEKLPETDVPTCELF